MDSPLRILHVVVNMNRGGAETLIMNLYRNINRDKVQFDFLTFKPGVFDMEILEMGGKVHRIPYIADIGHIGFTRKLSRFFKENQDYKIIHSHMDKMSGFILKYAEQANIPVRIAHSHNTESEGNFLAKLYKWYGGSHILRSATHLYACSNKAAKWLFGNKSMKAYILKNGIETDKFKFSINTRKKVRSELQVEKDTMVIGHIGRFSHQKNHLFLLDLFSNIHKKIPNSKLVLVGDGPLRQEIEKKVKKLNLEDRVKLLGIRPDTHRVLQAFDLFLFPSLHEGLPVTLIEAQGAGLPCLISNQITREVDMGIGLVQYFPLTDKASWVSAINNLELEKQPRDILQTALAQNGYNIKETAERMEQSYLAFKEKAI